MKKKLLAIVAAVAMVAALLVPMFAVSAADDKDKKVVFDFGEITYNTNTKTIDVPLKLVQQPEGLDGLYTAIIVLKNDQGLSCDYIDGGDISDSYNDGRKDVTYGFNYTPNTIINKLVIDSAYAASGVKTTGTVAIFSYNVPESFDASKLSDYTFSFGEGTQFVYFKGNTEVAYAFLCHHTKTKDAITKAANCTEDGKKNIVCEACGEPIQKDVKIPATGHHMVRDAENDKSAGCGKPGTEAWKCDNDGCTYTEGRDTDALEHDWVEDKANSKAAGCESAGVYAEKCNREGCTETRTTPITALGHEWVEDKANSKAADCTNAGVYAEKCNREGCTSTRTTPITALGHDMKGEVTKEATLEEEGEMTYTCKNGCGETKKTSISKLKTEVKSDNFTIKTEDGKGIPADSEITKSPVAANNGIKYLEGLKGISEFALTFETSNADYDAVKGELTIDISDVDTKKFNNLTVGLVAADGSVTKVDATFADGKVTFNGNITGRYVLMGSEANNTTPSGSTNTADNVTVVLYALAAVVAVAGVVFVGKKRFAL